MAPKLTGSGLVDCPLGGSQAFVTVGPHAWCDYVTDGTDDEVQIQAAIDYFDTNSLRGTIQLTADDFYLQTSSITLDISNVKIQGMPGTTIYCDNNYGDIFILSSGITDISFKDITFIANYYRTSGKVFNCTYLSRCKWENINIFPKVFADITQGAFVGGIYINRFDRCAIEHSQIVCSGVCVAVNGHTDNSWGVGLSIHGGSVLSTSRVSGSIGLLLGGASGGVVVDDCDIIQCGTGVRLDRSLVACPNREIFFDNGTTIDSCGINGILIAADSLSDSMHISGGWYAGCGSLDSSGAGIRMVAGSSQWPEILINGAHIKDNIGGGVVINHCSLSMHNCIVHANGDASHANNGINLGSTLVATSLTGNNIHNNYGYAIVVAAGANYYIITGNQCKGNTGTISDSGGSNKLVTNNLV